jgi:hypothetical protein
MILYAIDPGTIQSAVVALERGGPHGYIIRAHDTVLNADLLHRLQPLAHKGHSLVIEQIESMGMAVGQDVFLTVWWSGRFFQAWPGECYQLPRRPIKLHLCGSMQAKDANIRAALLDKFGGKDVALGRKASPGPLYGVKGHEFAALAVGITWLETAGV